MINIQTFICLIGIFTFISGGNFNSEYNDVFAQVISNNLEESDIYTNLSNILDNTKNNLDNVTQAINAGEKDNALNIISNITTNIKEIENGLNLLVNNPIYGGD